MDIDEFQKKIEAIYFERDKARGVEGCYMWLVEEIGELSRALRRGDRDNKLEEFSDCLAWLSTLASIEGFKLSELIVKYENGCPRCQKTPCEC